MILGNPFHIFSWDSSNMDSLDCIHGMARESSFQLQVHEALDISLCQEFQHRQIDPHQQESWVWHLDVGISGCEYGEVLK